MEKERKERWRASKGRWKSEEGDGERREGNEDRSRRNDEERINKRKKELKIYILTEKKKNCMCVRICTYVQACVCM